MITVLAIWIFCILAVAALVAAIVCQLEAGHARLRAGYEVRVRGSVETAQRLTQVADVWTRRCEVAVSVILTSVVVLVLLVLA